MNIKNLYKILGIALLLIFICCIISSAYIQVNASIVGTDYIVWNWSNSSNVSYISVDGKFINNFDVTSNQYILSDLTAFSIHVINVYNSSQNGTNITTTLPITRTQQEIFFSYLVQFVLLILSLPCMYLATKEKLIGLIIICLGFLGILTSIGNSFIMGTIFCLILIIGFFQSFGGN